MAPTVSRARTARARTQAHRHPAPHPSTGESMNDPGLVRVVTTAGELQLPRRRVLALTAAAALVAGVSLGVGRSAASATPDPVGGFPAARFADPRPDSRPTVLWFWNGTVTTDLVTTQLADLRAKGVHEVLVFPFDTSALRPRFFTEDWFSLIEFTLREAERHGMHLWLF